LKKSKNVQSSVIVFTVISCVARPAAPSSSVTSKEIE